MRWLNRTVTGAGITSALGDLCYETATVILPGFLAVLGIPAAALGTIEGAADAVSSFTKLASGHIADKLGHRKLLVLAGYALTPAGQALIALAHGWPLILAGRMISWFGKGVRGPLRDAIVIQSVDAQMRGRAMGFHRSMDTVGAVIGPLLGVGLLGYVTSPDGDATDPFRAVLWISLIPGVLAVVAFLLLVKDPARSPNPRLTLLGSLRGLSARFRRYLQAVGVFGLGDFSHSLLILAATQLLTESMGIVQAAQAAGLLYVWRNVVQVSSSLPIGALADRFGSARILVMGYGLGALTAMLTAMAFWLETDSIAGLAAIFAVAGLYMATQETLESTTAAALVERETLTTGYGLLGAVNGSAKFLSSSAVGVLWTFFSPTIAFGIAAAFMMLGCLMLRRTGDAAGTQRP